METTENHQAMCSLCIYSALVWLLATINRNITEPLLWLSSFPRTCFDLTLGQFGIAHCILNTPTKRWKFFFLHLGILFMQHFCNFFFYHLFFFFFHVDIREHSFAFVTLVNLIKQNVNDDNILMWEFKSNFFNPCGNLNRQLVSSVIHLWSFCVLQDVIICILRQSSVMIHITENDMKNHTLEYDECKMFVVRNVSFQKFNILFRVFFIISYFVFSGCIVLI